MILIGEIGGTAEEDAAAFIKVSLCDFHSKSGILLPLLVVVFRPSDLTEALGFNLVGEVSLNLHYTFLNATNSSCFLVVEWACKGGTILFFDGVSGRHQLGHYF